MVIANNLTSIYCVYKEKIVKQDYTSFLCVLFILPYIFSSLYFLYSLSLHPLYTFLLLILFLLPYFSSSLYFLTSLPLYTFLILNLFILPYFSSSLYFLTSLPLYTSLIFILFILPYFSSSLYFLSFHSLYISLLLLFNNCNTIYLFTYILYYLQGFSAHHFNDFKFFFLQSS